MKKTTLYLPDNLKRQIENAARRQKRSEADVIRDAIAASLAPSAATPTIPLSRQGLGDPTLAEHVDDLMDDFGR